MTVLSTSGIGRQLLLLTEAAGEDKPSTFTIILFVLYLAAGWWAANRVIFANYEIIAFGSEGCGKVIFYKLMAAMLLGWALIPIAIIKAIINR